jgi:hypothetical protein
MKKLLVLGLLLSLSATTAVVAEDSTEGKFGDTRFVGYEGDQSWPIGDSTQVLSDFSVPIYIGLPTKPYTVLGRIVDPRTSGLGVMTRAFAEGLFSEKDRQRDVANQAKYRGADAVLVTSDERVMNTLRLTKQDVEKTTPLFDYKDKVTLAVKFRGGSTK